MPIEMNSRHTQLPVSVWCQILDQIPRPQLLPLMFVNRELRALVIDKLYRKATFSSFKNEGCTFASAIRDNYICPDVVSTISTAEIIFTSSQEANDLVVAISSICEKLSGLKSISVACHHLEDAVWTVNTLMNNFPNVLLEIRCSSYESPSSCFKLSNAAKEHISVIAASVISAGILKELPNLRSFSAAALIHDPNYPITSIPFIDTLILSFVDWESLHFPTSRVLQLHLYPNYICVQRDHEYLWDKVHMPSSQVQVNSSILEELKLVGSKYTEKAQLDMEQAAPDITVNINSFSLRRLFLCNLQPSMVNLMLNSAIVPALELISFFPVTVPSLRGLLTSSIRPNLVFAVVTDSSFRSKDDSEIAALTRWLQDTARVCPLDLRDLSNSIDREIYFSDGMWCNIAQTRFKPYAVNAQP